MKDMLSKILDTLNNKYVVAITVLVFWILALIGLFKSDNINIYLGQEDDMYQVDTIETEVVTEEEISLDTLTND